MSAAVLNRSAATAAEPAESIVLRVVSVVDRNEDPAAAGKQAAAALSKAMGPTPLRAVLVAESFEDRENKQKLLDGICAVLPKERVYGASAYGAFSQAGATDADAVTLLGIGGEGIAVQAALVTQLGTARLIFDQDLAEIEKRLTAAGKALAEKLPRGDRDRLLLVLADAHSPKNEFLVKGLQQVVGPAFPITGGSANKNAGQTFVYFAGQMHADSAVGLMIGGDFRVTLAGRQAKDNDRVIATAKEAAVEALAGAKGKPLGILAFDCAGRRGKLKTVADELAAIQEATGKDVPLFGCYCAGEVGPLDTAEKQPGVTSGGSGWHVMMTVIAK
jgi:hypothetical protein